MKQWEEKARSSPPPFEFFLLDTYLVIPPMLIQQGDDGLDVALGYQI